MNLVERALRQRRAGRFLSCLALATFPLAALAADPIASSSFVGQENPLYENGAWQPITSMSPDGVQFQKNNGAFPNLYNPANNNHAGARTTAAVPNDHYSEIVVGHIGSNLDYVGAFARLQPSGSSVDSGYLYWASLANGANNYLYRIVATGSSYSAAKLVPHSPVVDGDRSRAARSSTGSTTASASSSTTPAPTATTAASGTIRERRGCSRSSRTLR